MGFFFLPLHVNSNELWLHTFAQSICYGNFYSHMKLPHVIICIPFVVHMGICFFLYCFLCIVKPNNKWRRAHMPDRPQHQQNKRVCVRSVAFCSLISLSTHEEIIILFDLTNAGRHLSEAWLYFPFCCC